MAERVRLSIPSGQIASHRLVWKGDQSLGHAGPLGSLEWSVVVLDELTIDLEVSVQLRRPEGNEKSAEQEDAEANKSNSLLLQEVTRERTFRGTFDPSADDRIQVAQGGVGSPPSLGSTDRGYLVEAVVFEFNNAFSWMTGKEVELVALRVRPSGPPPSLVLPLPLSNPLAPPPRGEGHPGEGDELRVPDLKVASSSPGVVLSGKNGARDVVSRFAAFLDEALAAAEEKRPQDEGRGRHPLPPADASELRDLLARVQALRGLCRQVVEDQAAAEVEDHAAEVVEEPAAEVIEEPAVDVVEEQAAEVVEEKAAVEVASGEGIVADDDGEEAAADSVGEESVAEQSSDVLEPDGAAAIIAEDEVAESDEAPVVGDELDDEAESEHSSLEVIEEEKTQVVAESSTDDGDDGCDDILVAADAADHAPLNKEGKAEEDDDAHGLSQEQIGQVEEDEKCEAQLEETQARSGSDAGDVMGAPHAHEVQVPFENGLDADQVEGMKQELMDE